MPRRTRISVAHQCGYCSSVRRPMIRIPRIGGTAVFLAAWLMPWRPAFKVARDRLAVEVFRAPWPDRPGYREIRHARTGPHPLLENYLTHAPKGIFIDAWLLDRNLIENGVENVIVSNTAVG